MTTEQQIEQSANEYVEKIESEFRSSLSFGDRTSDNISSFVGSWRFIAYFAIFLLVWTVYNTLPFAYHFDSPPFILLNLCLSFVAAFQAPIIMMSQNRTSAKERYCNELDFKSNYIARKEIQELHQPMLVLASKVDDITEMHKESQEQIAILSQMLVELHKISEEVRDKENTVKSVGIYTESSIRADEIVSRLKKLGSELHNKSK